MQGDQRNAYRFEVSPGDQIAVLKIGTSNLNVRIQEKSSTGYGVTLEGKPKRAEKVLEPGQFALLATVDGCQKVRIARVVSEEEPLRIGLERLHDVRSEVADSRLKSMEGDSSSRKLFKTIKVLSAFAIATVAFAWGMTYLNKWVFQKDNIQKIKQTSLRGEKVKFNKNGDDESPRQREERLKAMLEEMERFSSPKLIGQLQLNQRQRKLIDNIIEQTAYRLSVIYQSRSMDGSDEWSKKSIALVEDSWKQIENCLTARQKKKLRELFPDHENLFQR